MKPRSALLAFGILGIAIPAVAQDGREAIRVVAVHPDRQLAALLDLFRGARVPHPPAALVGWKKATGRSLEKSTEAAITLLHPWNIDEFRRLDGAEMAVRFGGGPGPISWWLRIPKDDGAAAAIATALALTDGGRDLPIDGRPVDRLGPPGSALMTTLDDGPTLAASGRETLALAIDPGRGPHPDAGEMSSGFVARIVPGSVGFPDALRPRQAIELIRGLGADEIRLETGLEADSWFARCRTRLEAPPEAAAALEPGWLDDLPGEGVFAAGAVAIDPRPASWNALFRAVDRAIHADPEQANVAPIRARLSTITLPAGIALEAQVWPRIRGIAAAARASKATGDVDGMVLILRATDEASADRMARQVAPKLARVLGVKGTAEPADDPSFTRLGRLRGRPLEIRRDGDRLAIGWGEGMLAASIGPNRDPSRMLGARLRSLGIDPADSCHHAAVVWPARLPAGWADPAQSTLALESLGPVTWVGRVGPSGAVDEFRALGLADSVRKFLDELPIAPEEQP